MKVLIINGSPHPHGNTAIAVNELVKKFEAEHRNSGSEVGEYPSSEPLVLLLFVVYAVCLIHTLLIGRTPSHELCITLVS